MNGWGSLCKRVSCFVGAALCVLMTGCLSIQEQTADQADFIGPVQLTTTFCEGSETECSTRYTSGSQVTLGHLVPVWAEGPPSVPLGGDIPVALNRSVSLEQELQRLEPAPEGTKWVGYLSDPIEISEAPSPPKGVARVPFEVPVEHAGEAFTYATVVGGRDLNDTTAAHDPVSCGSAIDAGGPGVTTACGSSQKPQFDDTPGPETLSLATRAMSVAGPSATTTVQAGSTAALDFGLVWHGASLPDGEAVELDVASTLPCAQLPTIADRRPEAGTGGVPVSISIPEGAPSGTYEVSLTGYVGEQLRRATAQLVVEAAPGSAEDCQPVDRPPRVRLSSPRSGASVRGAVPLKALARDDHGIASVAFEVDGDPVGTPDAEAPYEATWNASGATPGAHDVVVKATDTSGQVVTSSTVTVDVPEDRAPQVSITSPEDGDVVRGWTAIAVDASDESAVSTVQVLVDGQVLEAYDDSAPYAIDWDAVGAGYGEHQVVARATDDTGNVADSDPVTVTVAPDEPPAVEITAPTAGEEIDDVYTLRAEATDDVAVGGVEFTIDGFWIGRDVEAPYELEWDPATFWPGDHHITANAYDSAYQSVTSAPVAFTVRAPAAPVLAFAFDEAGGTHVEDASGAQNHGMIEGARWYSGGKYGSALAFDEAGDRVTVPDSASLDLTTGFTIEAWVRPRGTSGVAPILAKEMDATPAVAAYGLDVPGATGGPAAHTAGSSWSAGRADATTPLPAGRWSHVAATYDGTELRVTVDGEEVARNTAPPPGSSDEALRIGWNSLQPERGFDGLIDEVRVFPSARSDGAIAGDRERPIGHGWSPRPQPVLELGFDERDGDVLTDASPAGNAGTLAGARRTQAARNGRALSFDGAEAAALVPSTPELQGRDELTVEGWVRPRSDAPWQSVFSTVDPDDSTLGYAVWGAELVGDELRLSGSAGDTAARSSTVLPRNEWTHVAMTMDGERLRVYADAQLVADEPAPPPARSAQPLRIGGGVPGSGRGFDGLIDEVRAYDRALTAEQIAEDREDLITDHVDDPTPVVHLRFDEESGSEAIDSGGGPSGTITGATREPDGHAGRSLVLDGEDDAVTVPSSDGANIRDETTVGVWLRPTVDRTAPVLVRKDGSYEIGGSQLPDTEHTSFTGAAGADVAEAMEAVELPLDRWSHVAVTFDGRTTRLVVNGREVDSSPASLPGATSSPLTIGEGFEGEIDDVTVYDVAFDARLLRSLGTGVDQDAPILTLGGSVPGSAGTPITGDNHDFIVLARDTGAGISGGSVEVDGEVWQTLEDPGCYPGDRECGINRDWDVDPLTEWGPGRHTIKVSVTDHVGRTTSDQLLIHVDGPVEPRPAAAHAMEDRAVTELGGRDAGDRLGSSVAGISDINGDGVDDYLVGAPGVDLDERENAGVAYVLFGRRDGTPPDLTTLDAASGYRILGAEAGDRAGTAVRALNDVNGDQIPDLLVGAPGANPVDGTDDTRGALYVVFGTAAEAATVEDVDLAELGTRGFRIDGPTAQDPATGPFGRSVSGSWSAAALVGASADPATADVNADGLGDIVTAARESGGGSAVYVVFGRADTTPVALETDDSAAAKITGPAGEQFGAAVLSAGDVNRDGHADVAIGAPMAGDVYGPERGAVYVVRGAPGLADTVLPSTERVVGWTADAHLGTSLAAIGDADGDGRADILAGGQVAGLIKYGNTLTRRISGPQPLTNVAGVGDVNYDGTPDYAFGSSVPGAPVRILYGPRDTWADAVIDVGALGGHEGFTLAAPDAATTFGVALDGAGAARGANAADQLIGSPEATVDGKADAGRVWLTPGAARDECIGDGDVGEEHAGALVTCFDGLGELSIDDDGDGEADTTQRVQPQQRSARRAADSPRNPKARLDDLLRNDTGSHGELLNDHEWQIRRTGVVWEVDSRGRAREISRLRFYTKILLSGRIAKFSGYGTMVSGVYWHKPRMSGFCEAPSIKTGRCLSQIEDWNRSATQDFVRPGTGLKFGDVPGAIDIPDGRAVFRQHYGMGATYRWRFNWYSLMKRVGSEHVDFSIPTPRTKPYVCPEDYRRSSPETEQCLFNYTPPAPS